MDDKISLLIVEDEPAEQAAFAECLQNERQIELVGITGSETEALALVDSGPTWWSSTWSCRRATA